MNFASGVLSADPGAAGTVLTSGNFAFLPAVASPHTMRLALDPDGIAGAPEIVIVTAHTAAATTVTVTRGQETAYGAGAARAHATDTVWRAVITRATMLEMAVPAGVIDDYVGTVAPIGYVLLQGQTVVNFQTLYPAAWAVLPTSMKSAPDAIMPDTRRRVLVGHDATDPAFDTIGETGGARDAALVAHTHAGPSHTHTGPSHTHGVGSIATTAAGAHTHTVDVQGNFVTSTGGPYFGVIPSGAAYTTTSSGSHAHAMTGATASDGTAATGLSGTDATGSTGGSATDANLQPYLVVSKMMKVH